MKLSPTGHYLNTSGVAHYRAGNWQPAIESLNQSIDSTGELFVYNAFYLAMTHWQLLQKEEALGWYEKGMHWLKENGAPSEDTDFDRNSSIAEAQKLLGITK